MRDVSSGPAGFVRRGVLLGSATLLLAVPPTGLVSTTVADKTAVDATVPSTVISAAPALAAVPPAALPTTVRLAVFGEQQASAEVRHVANWAVHTGDHKRMSFVIVDKKEAKVFVFDPRGRLAAATPALMGSAHGDHTVPGIGDRPLSQVLPHERTTPAGRFVAEPGVNTNGEDIVWVDYEAAVSLHRVRPNKKSEQRLERLASPTADDNRISFGCINLPVVFYEKVLSPTVQSTGAIVYVLPETRTPAEVFGSFDVAVGTRLAQR